MQKVQISKWHTVPDCLGVPQESVLDYSSSLNDKICSLYKSMLKINKSYIYRRNIIIVKGDKTV